MDGKILKGIICAVIVTISITSAFIYLSYPPMGNHESYVAVTAKNMIKTGNWVVPYFNGELRLQKTPLCYWLVAAAGKAAGGINDFTARLPGALLSVLSAIAIFYFVNDRLGFRIGALSTLVWSSTLCFVRYSHTARPEMTLCVFVTIAMLSFYSGIKTTERKKQICFMLIFWISFALAMLAKGPAPLPLICPALFLYFLIFKQWKLVPKTMPIIGTILFLLLVLPWPIAIIKNVPSALEIWNREFISRAEGEYAPGSKPIFYYFEIMFIYMIPYCAFIPLALFAPFYRIWQEKRDALWFNWIWFLAGILVMSACGGKRQHYILPMMPAMAVMAGIILNDLIFERKAYDIKFAKFFLFGHIIAAIIVAGVFIFAMPNIESKESKNDDAIKLLATGIKSKLPDTEVIAYCNVDASFIYYLDKDVPKIYDINDVYAQYEKGRGVFAMDRYYEQMKKDSRFNLYLNGSDNERGFFMNH
jgi:4-amino-4-deoxy-L-arabinose transferase-like glycosyltransferase